MPTHAPYARGRRRHTPTQATTAKISVANSITFIAAIRNGSPAATSKYTGVREPDASWRTPSTAATRPSQAPASGTFSSRDHASWTSRKRRASPSTSPSHAA